MARVPMAAAHRSIAGAPWQARRDLSRKIRSQKHALSFSYTHNVLSQRSLRHFSRWRARERGHRRGHSHSFTPKSCSLNFFVYFSRFPKTSVKIFCAKFKLFFSRHSREKSVASFFVSLLSGFSLRTEFWKQRALPSSFFSPLQPSFAAARAR